MNTRAIALPYRQLMPWDRIRGLYNGIGYVFALCLIVAAWWSIQVGIQHIIEGRVHGFIRGFSSFFALNLYSMLPAPFVIPVVVNLAPRTGVRRMAWLFAVVISLAWWCLYVADGVRLAWNWPSLGIVIDGLLTVSLVVGLCAYHGSSREAEDSLLRTRIEQADLAAELQRSQLRLLRAQIEPHFLFNTLSVVRALARKDRLATVGMLDNLIHYFSAALPQLSGNDVPLAQEVRLIEAYLAIYRARMGARLTYEVALPQDLAQIRVPSMILLTLVENALKHGVGPTVEGGYICISAARERDSLRLEVADSGRGLDLRQGCGAGLANVRQRLLMMYGPGAVLSLKAGRPHGVVASILMPAG